MRVNLLRTTREAVEQRLASEGIKTSRSPWLPSILNVEGTFNITANQAFREGLFTVQDEGAAMAIHLAAPSPGIRVIDLCAAPGGKSTAMAELMNGNGEIIALDKYEPKLKLIAETAERLGLAETIHTSVGDASTITLPPADLVVVDAPCSGLGTLSKKPDIKWKREPEDIPQLAALQRAILANAAKLVRSAGVLLYSTCTIERRENQEVVEAFLADHPEFMLEPASEWLPAAVVTEDGFMQTLPHRHGLDGMFAARLRRKG
ncbi:MAG: ribosomal RNA small subunit methyltransferase B [Chlorobi bacterium OLB7]|nr:MAG: ribosomal RNA small subunit methyltransferase B [Chlorobi bacterium OLB7]